MPSLSCYPHSMDCVMALRTCMGRTSTFKLGSTYATARYCASSFLVGVGCLVFRKESRLVLENGLNLCRKKDRLGGGRARGSVSVIGKGGKKHTGTVVECASLRSPLFLDRHFRSQAASTDSALQPPNLKRGIPYPRSRTRRRNVHT